MTEKKYVRKDPGGAFKIGETRVSLDSVVYAYLDGCSAESIAEQYPSLTLDEVYGAIACYLANREEVHEYLKQQDALWEKVKAEIYAKPSAAMQRLRAIKALQNKHAS